MKTVIGAVAATESFDLEEVDVDSSPALRAEFGEQVPVLFIDGRKAFKVRLTARQLKARLTKRRLISRWIKFSSDDK